MRSLNLYNILLEQQSVQNNNAYYEKLQKEYDQLTSKNKNQLENPSPYWFDSPDFKRIQELQKLLEPYTKQKQVTSDQLWLKSIRDTVNDQSASYPQAEKNKDRDMWLNMWARDFILDFTKNEISKYVPSGSYGYCRKGYIHTYDYKFNKQEVGVEREFQGRNSLYQQLLNIKNLNKDNSKPKLYICDSQLEMMKYGWDHKFDFDGEKIGWFNLLNLDWGVADKQKMQSAWNVGRNYIATNRGEYCTENGQGVHCNNAVYEDPLSWFKDPHNLLTFLEITTVFIPIVGPFISAGFGLGNAALYYSENNKKDAAISAFFALLPGLGAIGSKVVGKLMSKELNVLSEKLIKNGITETKGITKEFLEKNANKFTQEEIDVLKNVTKNEDALKIEMSKIPYKDPKKLAEYISKIENKGVITGTDVGINVAGIPAGLAAYPIFKKLKPGVREKLEEKGYDFETIKYQFQSSGSAEDNLLMIAALNDGWTPDKIVPEKYQTAQYKKYVETTINNFSNTEISELPDQKEWNEKMDNWEKEIDLLYQ